MTAKTTNRFWFLPFAALGTLLPIAPVAQPPADLTPKSEDARQYQACMALARQDPKAAHESARAWRQKGGGIPATHCIAVALLGLGQHHLSGQMLEELADRTATSRVALRAGLLSQAANAWLIAGQSEKSEKLLAEALLLTPKNVDILIDRSVARATQKKYFDALDDLNEAVELMPDRVDALTFRASAWRHVGALDLAEKDVAEALKRRPSYPEALLERGLIHKSKGDLILARADWLRVLDIAVEGPLTNAAQRNLQSLNAKK